MASCSSPSQKGNLLLTLPPELRNVIYALLITTDFYELDPTISVKTAPRPRYNLFGIKRGIKAQGSTPEIAQTCREIRAEVLDIYYGRNTFALVGNSPTPNKHGRQGDDFALLNRIAAHGWLQAIGDSARYLRKVRFFVTTLRGDVLYDLLVSVIPDEKGDMPLVTAVEGERTPKSDVHFRFRYDIPSSYYVRREQSPEQRSRRVEDSILRFLAETGDMGRVWRNIVERALYPAELDMKDRICLDITETGIAKAKERYPFEMPKAASKKHASANVYQMPGTRPAHAMRQPAQPKQAKIPNRAAEPMYDSDCMEIEAPTKKVQTLTTAPTAPKQKLDFDRVQAEDSDIMEIEAPAKKKKIARQTKGFKGAQGTEQMTAEVSKVAHNAALEVERDEDLNGTMVEAPAKKAKTTKKAKARDATSRPATRASTGKRLPRKL